MKHTQLISACKPGGSFVPVSTSSISGKVVYPEGLPDPVVETIVKALPSALRNCKIEELGALQILYFAEGHPVFRQEWTAVEEEAAKGKRSVAYKEGIRLMLESSKPFTLHDLEL